MSMETCSLNILMTNNTLAERGGSELYVRDIAFALKLRGHTVVAYSSHLGKVAEELRELGIAVTDNLEEITRAPDVIHGHHHLDAVAAALHFPDSPLVYACHGWVPWEEAAVPYPLAVRYVAVSDPTYTRLVTSGVPANLIEIIPNFVDIARFKTVRPADRPIRKALAFGNPWCESESLRIIRETCAAEGISVDAIGHGMGNPIARPEEVLPEYDLVFGLGRSAIEAMACGCAVVIADPAGMDGLVTMAEIDRQRAGNFGRALVVGKPITREKVLACLEMCTPNEVQNVTDYVRSNFGIDVAVGKWIEQYRLAILAERRTPRELLSSAARYLARVKRDLRHHEAENYHAQFRLITLGSELCSMKTEKINIEQRNSELETLVRNLEKKCFDLNLCNSTLQNQNKYLESVVLDVGGQNQLLKKNNDALIFRNDELEAQNYKLKGRVQKLEFTLQEQHSSVVQIKNSRSWRITRPLRVIGRIIRRIV